MDAELDDLDEDPPDTFGFSFVDMVSGGFGAAFFLFLVFATLPIDVGAPGGGGERFIQVWLTWPGGDEADVTFEPIIEYSNPEASDWSSYRLTEGRLQQTGQFGNMSYGTGPKAFWSSVFGAGFSDAGGTAMRAVDIETGSERSGLWLHFSDPCPGRYRLRVNRNAGFEDLLLSRAAASKDYTYNLVLETSGLGRLAIDGLPPGDGSELAPLIALDPDATDQDERFEFLIDEPKKADSDMDHCK